MQCSQCHTENPPQAKFCNECGSRLDAVPDRDNPASYTPKHLADKILGNRSAMEGERKQVTVLFADIKSSLELSNSVDPEVWHQVLDRFFALLGESIHKYEGTINQYTGDGVMALFGAPLALEDHAVRACRAALELTETTREYAKQLRLSEGLNVSMRFGLNTGEVIVGKIGDDLRMDYTAQGATVGLAARMEAIAEPGKAYVTEATASMAQGYVALNDLGEARIKGIGEPVRVHELLSVSDQSLRLDRSRERGLSGFVGREAEMAVLNEALQAVQTGGESPGRMVAVSGNAGLGKSRLCLEFLEQCRKQGIPTHACSGLPYGDAMPLYPVQALFRSLAGIRDANSPAEQRRKLAGALALAGEQGTEDRDLLFDFLGVAAEGLKLEVPEEIRQRRLLKVFRSILVATADEPTVILIEDLHWLDKASSWFLYEAFRDVESLPVLQLLNARPGDIDDSILCGSARQIELQPLGQAEMSTLLGTLLGPDESLSALQQQVAEQASGNPFFVEEAVRSLAEDGQIIGDLGNYRLAADVSELKIPATVQSILAARIDRLDQADKDLLQLAAVIGQHFDQSLLLSICGCEADSLDPSLQTLAKGGYIRHEQVEDHADICWEFVHPLTQEVAYSAQLKEQRAKRHLQIAEWLEARLPDAEDPTHLDVYEDSLQLARHYQRSGDHCKAVEWTYESARFTVSRDMEDSINRFRKVVELTEEDSGADLQRYAIRARAAIVRSSAFIPVPQEEVQRNYDEARAMVDANKDQYALAELLVSYSAQQQQAGDADRAVAMMDEALSIAHELGNNQLQARFRVAILLSYFSAGRLSEGRARLGEAGGADWEAGPITGENLASRGFLSLYRAYQGDLQAARDEVEAAIELTRQTGRNISWLFGNQIDIAWLGGDASDVLSAGQQAVLNAEEYGSPLFRSLARRSLATAYLMVGQPAQALQIFEESLPLTEPGGIAHQFYGVQLSLMALTLKALGRHDEAVEHAERAVVAAESANARIWQLRAHLALVETLLARAVESEREEDIVDRITAAFDAAEALMDSHDLKVFHGSVLELKSRAAHFAGDPEAAATLLQQARESYLVVAADGHAKRIAAELSAGNQTGEDAAA